MKNTFFRQHSEDKRPTLYEIETVLLNEHDIEDEQLYSDGLLDVSLRINKDKIRQKFNYDVDSWFGLLFAVKGRSFPWLPWLLVMFVATLFVLIDEKYEICILGPGFNMSVNSVVHSTFGSVLGFLIVYQADKACSRWWEGRVAWENIVTEIRECMRLFCSHCKGKKIIKLFGKYLIAFSLTTKHYLRQEYYTLDNPCPQLAAILPDDDVKRLYKVTVRNRPLACLYAAQRIVEMSIQSGLFSRPVARDVNPRFVSLSHQLGACERVLLTPLPLVYSLHLWHVLLNFLLITPLRLFAEEQLPTILTFYFYMGILSYIFLGLQDMSTKIQNPFGQDPSHLPLDIFIFVVYRDIRDIIYMKYKTFNKKFTDEVYEMAKDEIEFRRGKLLEDDYEDEEDGDD